MKEMMENKQWDTIIDTKTYVHGTNSTKGHVISSGTRIRKKIYGRKVYSVLCIY